MVGHTHEDIDQSFSCLARHLNKHDALTYEGKWNIHICLLVYHFMCAILLSQTWKGDFVNPTEALPQSRASGMFMMFEGGFHHAWKRLQGILHPTSFDFAEMKREELKCTINIGHMNHGNQLKGGYSCLRWDAVMSLFTIIPAWSDYVIPLVNQTFRFNPVLYDHDGSDCDICPFWTCWTITVIGWIRGFLSPVQIPVVHFKLLLYFSRAYQKDLLL